MQDSGRPEPCLSAVGRWPWKIWKASGSAKAAVACVDCCWCDQTRFAGRRCLTWEAQRRLKKLRRTGQGTGVGSRQPRQGQLLTVVLPSLGGLNKWTGGIERPRTLVLPVHGRFESAPLHGVVGQDVNVRPRSALKEKLVYSKRTKELLRRRKQDWNLKVVGACDKRRRTSKWNEWTNGGIQSM